jgi:hypothetical protein
MPKWETHVDQAGTAEETEVHEVKLSTFVVEVTRGKDNLLWNGCIMNDSDLIIGTVDSDTDLVRAKMKVLTKAMTMLEKDGKILVDAMTETHGIAQAKRDELASQR